jgi:predicted O-methyltransferase YrrM
MSQWFKKKSMPIRHSIVKLIAPKLYEKMSDIEYRIGKIPRPMILFAKEYFKCPLTGVEIGVAKGDNALSILEVLPIKKLYLIDPYEEYVQDGFLVTEYKNCFSIAIEKLSKYEQACFIKKTSEEAVKDIKEQLDFVYIDGNHQYEYVKKDIAFYYPLVKQGGILGGHDYVAHHGVTRAVDEFAEQHGRLSFYAVFPDWWVLKK